MYFLAYFNKHILISVKIKNTCIKICFFIILLGGTVRLEPIKLQWRGAKSVQPTFKSAAETVR